MKFRKRKKGTVEREVAVAFAADEGVALGLYVSVYSLLLNASEEIQYVVYIFDGGLSTRTIDKIIQLGSRYPQAEIKVMSVSTDAVDELREPQHVGRGAYLRLLVPGEVMSRHQKVIYLDSDVLVLEDISKMYFRDMGGHTVMASKDYLYPTVEKVSEITEMPGVVSQSPNEPYFNSGVLLIDTKKWVNGRVTQKSVESLKKYPERSPFADQDALNCALSNSWGILEPKWNVQVAGAKKEEAEHLYENASRMSKIIHFNISIKPWMMGYNKMFREVYLKNILSSGWFIGNDKYKYAVMRSVGDTVYNTYNHLAELTRPIRHRLSWNT